MDSTPGFGQTNPGFGQTNPGFGNTNPASGQPNRRLAAVMFLDMVGYSAMMAGDEERALACVAELEKLLRAEVPKFGGRVVKFLGDGSMMEFPTALAAVRCSQSVLQDVESNNAWVPAEKRYGVRIGLHLGELVDRADDIFSNAVNVAARIQPLADPGGIAMSSFIYSQVENQLDLKGVYLPPQKLKNIPEICAFSWSSRSAVMWPAGPSGGTSRSRRRWPSPQGRWWRPPWRSRIISSTGPEPVCCSGGL